MPKWGKLSRGDRVLLNGAEYEVTKHELKKKGTVARVTVTGKTGAFTRDLSADTKVKLAPLHEKGRTEDGHKVKTQRRWATHDEIAKAKKRATSDPGHKYAKIIEEALEHPSRAELNVMSTLDGTPIATGALHKGYVLPDPTPATIAAHLYIFHRVKPGTADWPTSYAEQVEAHTALHKAGDSYPFHRHESSR